MISTSNSAVQWVLASASPRRREILSHIGLRFSILPADADESSSLTEPLALVEELATRKAQATQQLLQKQGKLNKETVILAADTIVVSPDGEILGKPHTAQNASRMLHALSGRTHQVVSGIAVAHEDRIVCAHEVTEVTFRILEEELIQKYIASGEPMDKAGAYGIQDTAALWVSSIRGDYYNVVGLPLYRLETLLEQEFQLSLLS